MAFHVVKVDRQLGRTIGQGGRIRASIDLPTSSLHEASTRLKKLRIGDDFHRARQRRLRDPS